MTLLLYYAQKPLHTRLSPSRLSVTALFRQGLSPGNYFVVSVASNSERALLDVSLYSNEGTEASTTPAPA